MAHAKTHILALDQGTTSSRAILLDKLGAPVAVAQQEFTQHFPQPGWVEHDALELWKSQLNVIREVLAKAKVAPDAIAGIGITNQRETTLLWHRKTGEPICRAIVWQDRRTEDSCRALREQGYGDFVRERTGLPIDPYFSATKLRWMLDNVENARTLATQGELAFGTVDTWLIWNLTGGRVHATDVSNASRTMLLNIHTLDWDSDLLNLFSIPRSLLPKVKESSAFFGDTVSSLFSYHIPITGVAGDQHAALFGQMCHSRGMVKNTYGTGGFMMLNTGNKLLVSNHNLISTVGWKRSGEVVYALEASVFIAGAAIQWLRDGLGIIKTSEESETLAKTVPDSGGVCFVPAFTGLGAPHWDANARGAIFGITRGTERGQIARAALEAIAFQTKDVVSAIEEDAAITLEELRVDGGAARNNLLMQFQADILQTPIIRPKIIETTAMGAGYFAGLETGFWKSLDDIVQHWQIDRVFTPSMPADEVESRLYLWHKAVERTKSWA
ncbi:glycerol kinase GlpK [bacterium]|nr:glycerol kinase GlpK [bacterium]